MSVIQRLIDELEVAGLRVTVEGADLRLSKRPPDPLLNAVRMNKQQLIDLLRKPTVSYTNDNRTIYDLAAYQAYFRINPLPEGSVGIE